MLRNAEFYLHRISIEHLFCNFKPRAKMQVQTLVTLLGCVLAVQCRDTSKAIKSIPTITGSLVNLGKMDISFHFNSKDLPTKTNDQNTALHSFLFSKPNPITEEPCPCSGIRNTNNFLNQPSDLLSRVLTSNDLFSFNKDPVSSTTCCGSHENVQEDIVTFEFGPKTMNSNSIPAKLPGLPFIFESVFPKRQLISSSMPAKPKAVEIFLLPKNRDSHFLPMKNEIKKDAIQIVGDKELRNDFKTMKFRPSVPINFQSSVKKDLTTQEKNETEKQLDKEEVQTTTAGNLNAI